MATKKKRGGRRNLKGSHPKSKVLQRTFARERAAGKTQKQAYMAARPDVTPGSARELGSRLEKDPEVVELIENEQQKFARATYAARDLVGNALAPDAFPLRAGARQPFTVKEAAEHALDASFMKAGGLLKDRIEHSGFIGTGDELKSMSLPELLKLKEKLERGEPAAPAATPDPA